MRPVALIAIALFATLPCSPSSAAAPDAAAPAAVQVEFAQPERFIDAGDGPADIRANLAVLGRCLQDLGRQWLQPGQSLRIEVDQVDLAGRVEPPLRLPQSLRVLRGGADWPRIELKYTLRDATTGAQESGAASISDPAYQVHPTAYSGESLRYERRMLAQWFRTRFGTRPAAAH